jgi:hypothetical protein
MALTGIIQNHLQAAGTATPEELLQRIILFPGGAEFLKAENPLDAIRAILSAADVARNEQGWCRQASSRPLRYTWANLISGAPTGDLSFASLTSQGVLFLNRDHVRTYLPHGIIEDSDKCLPDILGIRQPDLHRTARGLDVPPHSVVAGVVATEITVENLHETFRDAWCRTNCAHERYLIVGRISKDAFCSGKLLRITELFGIGVVEITRKNGFVYPVVTFPASRKPDDQILREVMHSPGAAQVLLAAVSASIPGDCNCTKTMPDTKPANSPQNLP